MILSLPWYIGFLAWRMKCGNTSGILEKNLCMLLWSVEMVSFLRVLSILHISICLLLQWLAENCRDMAEYRFGVVYMASVVDTMDKALFKIVQNGSKFSIRIL